MVRERRTLIVSNFDVTVEKLVYGGDGLARLDGRVVFTPFVLPGERVNVQAERKKPGLIHASTVKILEPSASRVAAPCPVFGRCGGCHYQHAPYADQLAVKRAILEEELRRLGKLNPPEEIAVSIIAELVAVRRNAPSAAHKKLKLEMRDAIETR